MEQPQDRNSENNGLSVEVNTKKYISSKKKDVKKTLEDTNCNLTILHSKSDEVLTDVDLITSCEKLSGLSLNGPIKLSNGIESVHFVESDCCTINNSNSKDISSQCETCVKASETPNESEIINSIDDKKIDTDHSSVKETSLCVNKISENKKSTILTNASCSNTHNVVSLMVCEGLQSSPGGLNLDKKEDGCLQGEITYVSYESELQMPDIMRLIQKDLSEPYSIYTYRYFIHNWPQLCFLAMDGNTCVGAIVCKLDMHRKVVKRGYIAMLAVDEKYRKRKIGSNLVLKAIRAMVADGADEVVLETEITNKPALRLYENLGFVRDKRLFRYYLNGVDALRLKLWLR